MYRYVSVPYPTCNLSEVLLCRASSQRIIPELHRSSVRTYNLLQHSVGRPFVEPSRTRCQTTDAAFLLHAFAVVPYARFLQLLELSENEVPLIIVVIETIRVLQKFSPGTVFAVFLIRCLKEVAHEVRHAVNHVRFRALDGFLPDKEVETVVVVAHDRSGQLVLLGEQPISDAPLVAVSPALDAARPDRLAHLAPETVALGADGYATGEGALHLQSRVVTHQDACQLSPACMVCRLPSRS